MKLKRVGGKHSLTGGSGGPAGMNDQWKWYIPWTERILNLFKRKEK